MNREEEAEGAGEKGNYLRTDLSQGMKGSITEVLSQSTEESLTKSNKEPIFGPWKKKNKSTGK